MSSIDEIAKKVEEIRESQLRTEKLVKDFVASMANNPMMSAMAKMFGKK